MVVVIRLAVVVMIVVVRRAIMIVLDFDGPVVIGVIIIGKSGV
jgi:hypothetical protein